MRTHTFNVYLVEDGNKKNDKDSVLSSGSSPSLEDRDRYLSVAGGI